MKKEECYSDCALANPISININVCIDQCTVLGKYKTQGLILSQYSRPTVQGHFISTNIKHSTELLSIISTMYVNSVLKLRTFPFLKKVHKSE